MAIRQITNKIYTALSEGLLTSEAVITACLSYMSEADVADMAHVNEFFEDDEDQ